MKKGDGIPLQETQSVSSGSSSSEKPPKDFRIWSYVGAFSLFIVCVALFNQWTDSNVAYWEYGKHFNLHRLNGSLRVHDENGRVALEGRIGTEIDLEGMSVNCRSRHPESIICLEWILKGRLKIRHLPDLPNNCHNIYWKSFTPRWKLKDCIHLKSPFWYGIGEMKEANWPLNLKESALFPFITGDPSSSNLGAVLERYWLTASGSAIIVEPDVPLFVTLNESNSLCFEAKCEPPYKCPKYTYARLNYTICSGSDLRSVHETATKMFFSHLNLRRAKEFIRTLIWNPGANGNFTLEKENVRNYLARIHRFKLPKGVVRLDPDWDGDWDLYKHSQTLNGIAAFLHEKRFKIIVPISPYACHHSRNFIDVISREYLVGKDHPNYFIWKDHLCGRLDLTEPSIFEWFSRSLKNVSEMYDGFLLKEGHSSNLGKECSFYENFINPDYFISHYLNISSNADFISWSSVGFRTQNLAHVIFTYPREASWNSNRGLNSIIPTILSLGLVGYPLVSTGPVGGLDVEGALEEELFIRWLEISMFLPIVEFADVPDQSTQIAKLIHYLWRLRRLFVLPALKAALDDFERSRAPVIRPLWWADPNSEEALASADQFLIGDNLMVAPILERNRRSRAIYLPPGMWRDGLNSVRIWSGSRWLMDYYVPLDKIPFFLHEDEGKWDTYLN